MSNQCAKYSDVNLVGKLGRVSGFKNWGSRVLKVKQMEALSTRLRVSSLEFLFNIHKSFYFRKVTTLENVFISYSCKLQYTIIFHGDPTIPHNPPIQISGVFKMVRYSWSTNATSTD